MFVTLYRPVRDLKLGDQKGTWKNQENYSHEMSCVDVT